jgi:hypothetical protein
VACLCWPWGGVAHGSLSEEAALNHVEIRCRVESSSAGGASSGAAKVAVGRRSRRWSSRRDVGGADGVFSLDATNQTDNIYRLFVSKIIFSKYPCLYPLKSKQVEVVADNISHFIDAFGPSSATMDESLRVPCLCCCGQSFHRFDVLSEVIAPEVVAQH